MGSKIQAGLARLVDRETGILERKGAFTQASPLRPPDTLAGRGFGVRFHSPLDRLRRANELLGVQRTFEFAGQMAQFDPAVLDRLDTDRALIAAAGELDTAVSQLEDTDEHLGELERAAVQTSAG